MREVRYSSEGTFEVQDIDKHQFPYPVWALLKPSYRDREVQRLGRVSQDGVSASTVDTYFVHYTQPDAYGPSFQTVEVVDVNYFLQSIGKGIISFVAAPGELKDSEKPTVLSTDTIPSQQRHGLGTRRYIVMNELAVAQFGLPLYSDTRRSDAANRAWARLVDKGLATTVHSPDNPNLPDRFHFLTREEQQGSVAV